MAKVEFKVTVDSPNGISREELKTYVFEAVSWWSKQYNPAEDPRFDIGEENIRVEFFKPEPLKKKRLFEKLF